MVYRLKASEVIEMGRKYKNWQEKRKIGTREQMWDFHWAAGDLNYTIWAMLYNDYTARNYQGQAWCAMYGTDIVALTFKERYGLTDAQAAAATKDFFGGDMPYNCQVFVNNHANDVRLTNKPTAGAFVIFWTGSKYGHWGLVTKVDANGKDYTSVEGNTSGGADKVDPDGGAVVEKWHSYDSRTRFYLPDYESESAVPEPIYSIPAVGAKGLRLTGNINVRQTPSTGTIITTLKKDTYIKPTEKTFVGNVPWYHIEQGWVSARFCEGWVLEDCGKWWYVHEGYTCTVRDWEQIDGVWYYMDDTGYIRVSDWVRSAKVPSIWYYLNKDGAMVTNKYVKSIDSSKWYWCNALGEWDETDNKATVTTKPAEDQITI